MTELNQEQHIQLLQFMSLMQNCKTENEMQELKEQYYSIPRYAFLQNYIPEKDRKENLSSYKTNLIYEMDKFQQDYRFVYGEKYLPYSQKSLPQNKADYTVLDLLNEISECKDIDSYQKLLQEKYSFPKAKIESLSNDFTGIYFVDEKNVNGLPNIITQNSLESNFNVRKQLVEAGYSIFNLPPVEDVKENGIEWLQDEISHCKEILNPNFIEMENQINSEPDFYENEYEEYFDDYMEQMDINGEMSSMAVAEIGSSFPNLEKKEIAANYVLEKLSKAGIEVITDKEEFDRILQRETHLQKMAGSLTPEEQKRYFTFDEEDSQKYQAQIDYWQKDNSNPRKLVIVGKIPPMFNVLGIADNLIEIEHSTLNKIVRDNPLYPNDEQGHKLSVDDIYAIPSQLADPVMVFKSRTRTDSFVFFTERKDENNNSILIPLAVNKKKGRIVINEITSMYGKDNEIDFVKKNIDENNLIYADKKRSLDWERSSQVQFLTQRFSNPSFDLSILTKERLVNFLSADSRKNNIQKMVLENAGEKNKSSNGELESKVQFLGQRITDNGTYDLNISQNAEKSSTRNMILPDGITYGFTYEEKIYLNPDVMNSNAAVHEYTHLWDSFTQKTNPELWQRGLSVFKNTNYWKEVINDPNYQDIKDDDNLVLSEIHGRICGNIAEKVLERIAEIDGEQAKFDAIDWDREVNDFVANEFGIKPELGTENYISDSVKAEQLKEFLSMPMKDLFVNERELKVNNELENKTVTDFEEYIHSEEFISKFGDWEKANRLEKLKESEPLIGSDSIIIEGVDVSDLVTKLQSSYSIENLKQLQNIARDAGREMISKLREEQNIKFPNPPVLSNLDSGKEFKVQMTGINEIKNHNIFSRGHIEAISAIPELIKNGIYISSELNEDGRKPQYAKFHYFSCGYKLDDEDYTAKIVFTETKDGEVFYDQSLSAIEKGRLIDIIQKKNMPETALPLIQGRDGFEQEEVLNPLISQENLDNYDKRLVSICQVPQLPYLEKNLTTGKWQPTKEAVEAVKNGTLFVEKQGQSYVMKDFAKVNKNTNIESSPDIEHNDTLPLEELDVTAEEIPAENLPDNVMLKNTATNHTLKGEIKSILDNNFSGENKRLAQNFQDELIAKGIIKPEEKCILINEREAIANGTKIKPNEPFVTLTIPVENNGKKDFVQTKYFHVSSLENSQNVEKSVEDNGYNDIPVKNDLQNYSNPSDFRPRNVQELHQFFINNSYVSGTPVPTIAMRNELTGHSVFIEGYEYEFARLEDIGRENIAFKDENGKQKKPDGQTVVLTKSGFTEVINQETGEKKLVPDESKRKFIKISRDLYEQAIKNSEIIAKRNPKNEQEREKMLDDYLEAANLDEKRQRCNTAANFWHNYQAGVMTLANNKQEAMSFAKRLVNEMIPSEKVKFANMVNNYEKIKGKDGKHLSYDQRILECYEDITKGLQFTNKSIWRDHIDKKYDTLDAVKYNTEVFDKEGQPLDKSCRMKVGDTIKMSVIVDSALSNKKIKLPPQEFRLVAHSKDNDSVALISADGKQKIIKSREDFIKQVQKIEKRQIKKQQRQDKYESISM